MRKPSQYIGHLNDSRELLTIFYILLEEMQTVKEAPLEFQKNGRSGAPKISPERDPERRSDLARSAAGAQGVRIWKWIF